jgi:hypothetical protein
MRKIVLALAMCGLVAGCTELERQDIQQDAAAYVGVPIDAKPLEIVAEAVGDLAAKGGNPAEMILYIVGGAVAIGGGYLKRKFILKTYAQAKAKVAEIVTKPEDPQ